MSRLYVEERVAVVYVPMGVRRTRRYLTERSAYRAVAWEMVRRKYPDEFVEDGACSDPGYFEPRRFDFRPTVERLTSRLMYRARLQSQGRDG